ncbi:MAG TPA: tyrosine-type recombinase/integrase, partial [Candidatus Methylomirabilis sp.]|nr:tyrosine-type recombinase/integrase [Candidatus Methylomirabilis sp.]
MFATTCEAGNANRGAVADFITERQYLKNVTPKTVAWYGDAFKAFDGALESQATIKGRIVELRTRGISATSVNSWLRCINAFLKWDQAGFKIPKLKEEQKVLATLSPEQMTRLIAFKPKGINQTRTHTAALLMLDGGYRVSELLGLAFEGCDFDNLVVKVRGKGNKHRLVPLSLNMRKSLYRHAVKHSGPGRLLFGTRNNTLVTVRNFQRDFKVIGAKLGITGVRFSPRTLRHTFAVSYLRAGGNLFYLSKILGHSSVTTTQHYLQSVGVDDLQAVHD